MMIMREGGEGGLCVEVVFSHIACRHTVSTVTVTVDVSFNCTYLRLTYG